MKKRKVLYTSITTNQGQTDNICPECNGEAVELGDYEQGQADIQVFPCGLCEATGIAVLDEDYKIDIDYTEHGPIHQIIKLK